MLLAPAVWVGADVPKGRVVRAPAGTSGDHRDGHETAITSRHPRRWPARLAWQRADHGAGLGPAKPFLATAGKHAALTSAEIGCLESNDVGDFGAYETSARARGTGGVPMTSAEVRDPVHGLIKLTQQEWRVVDSPAFQRLRGIQQLPVTHLVYPGARHSRFEHCVGACHLAGVMADRLGLAARERERVRTAALVHDVGHGPFSQVGEFVFEELTGQQHVHERISAAVVRYHEPIQSALDVDSEWIAELLEGTGHGARRSVARDIISGPVDIDKMDYLLRDSHYCGVEYGRYDLAKLIEAARVVGEPGSQGLAYHRDGVFAIEGLLLARYHMHRQVYGQKTRLGTDKMLIRAIIFGVQEGLLPRRVFAPENLDAHFVEEYLGWDDYRTIGTLCAANDSRAGEMARALTRRHLMKRVVKLEVDDLVSKQYDQAVAEKAISPQPAVTRNELETAEKLVAGAAGVDPMWVALHWEGLQNPVKEVPITDDHARSMKKFTELSEIFAANGGPRSRPSVSVYILTPAGGFSTEKLSAIRRTAIEVLHEVALSR
jgi:HD superfamily phosphohydrolase